MSATGRCGGSAAGETGRREGAFLSRTTTFCDGAFGSAFFGTALKSATRDRAASRLEQAGYTNVYGLMRAADGTWRGKATRAGQTVEVSIDAEGNIAPR